MSETLRKFLLIVAAVFGVLAFIFLVGLCTMASAADIPVAQRVKVMDGDTLSSNIIGTSAHPFFDNAIQSGVWSLRLNDGSGTLIGSVGDALKVNVTNSFAAGVPDKTTFVYGTTIQNSIGGVYQDTSPSVTAGQAGAVRITALRGIHVNLRDASGNETGLAAAPLSMQNIVSGVAVDPRARTWTLASGTDGVTALQGTAAALSGAWPTKITDGTNTMPTMDVVGRAGFQKITDGTNTAAVKAASTAALATDPASVVTLSPNGNQATAANQATEITALQLIDDVPTVQNGTLSKGVPIMGQLDDTSTTAATEDNVASVRITAQRAAHVNLRDSTGAELGTIANPAIVASVDGPKATYSASFNGLASATSATDIACIKGSATKTVRITRAELSGTTTAGSGASVNLQLVKRSTADTGGTSSALTLIPHDANDAAATASGVIYTANPTLGTTIGNVRAARLELATTGAAGTPLSWAFGNVPGSRGIVLRGTSQQLCMNLGTVTITGPTLDGAFEFTEE